MSSNLFTSFLRFFLSSVKSIHKIVFNCSMACLYNPFIFWNQEFRVWHNKLLLTAIVSASLRVREYYSSSTVKHFKVKFSLRGLFVSVIGMLLLPADFSPFVRVFPSFQNRCFLLQYQFFLWVFRSSGHRFHWSHFLFHD